MITKTVRTRTPKLWLLLSVLLAGVLVSGCGNMREQPKYQHSYDASLVFEQGAARDLDPNAVPVGYLRENEHLYEGTIDGEYADTFPIEINRDVLAEGRRLFEGYCSACHGYAGYGDGVTSAEGYTQPGPASYHIDRLRNQPVGYFYDVITNGQGLMYSYDARVNPEERWAIVAYIRALQYSQNANPGDLPADAQPATDDESQSSDDGGETP